jgi:uncharacterized membrane protein (GlpM family)
MHTDTIRSLGYGYISMQVPTAVRVLALIVGLAILAGVWTILTYVVWLFFALLGMIGRTGSIVVVALGVLTWAYVASLLFGLKLGKRQKR